MNSGSAGRERDTPWFSLRRTPGRIGALDITRLLAFEVVLVVVAFVASRTLWVALTVGSLGLLVTVVLFGRSGGRWWTDTTTLWLRFRLRRGVVGGVHDDPRITALRELVPDLAVEDIPAADDGRMGMGSDGAGWFTALEVVQPSANEVRSPLPLAALARLAADSEQAGVVIQAVSHSTPTTGGGRDRALWVAIRLDAAAVAESVIDEAARRVDVPAVLAELGRRATKVLRRRGITARPLGADELTDALARSCDVRPDTRMRPHETWHAWQSTRLAHGCFWLRSWPDVEHGASLLTALGELPSALVSIAVLLEPVHDGTGLRCLVRVAAPPDRYDTTCSIVDDLATRAGAELTRLDGQHAPAVYASAPSGGGAR